MAISHRKIFPALPLLASTTTSHGQDVLRYKYQYYDEEDGRIDVQSFYLDYKHAFEDYTIGLRFAVDSLSGMTPAGTHVPGDETNWEYAQIEDTRYVSVVTLEKEIYEHTLTFEYARSEESDYLSNAIATKWKRQYNEQNTTVTAGVAAAFDKIRPVGFLTEERNKDALDLSFGLSQLLGPKTIFDFTLQYGHSNGYLADPYRGISQQITPSRHFATPENRPESQNRWVAKLAARHYLPHQQAAISGSYRFFANSESLTGHTLEVKWIQQVTEELSITPYFRYYQQSAAEYYRPDLTEADFVGILGKQGEAPYFSSDYRLAALAALTYGVKFTYEPSLYWSLDLQLERYEMSGRSVATPSEFFPTANVISIGGTYSF